MPWVESGMSEERRLYDKWLVLFMTYELHEMFNYTGMTQGGFMHPYLLLLLGAHESVQITTTNEDSGLIKNLIIGKQENYLRGTFQSEQAGSRDTTLSRIVVEYVSFV